MSICSYTYTQCGEIINPNYGIVTIYQTPNGEKALLIDDVKCSKIYQHPNILKVFEKIPKGDKFSLLCEYCTNNIQNLIQQKINTQNNFKEEQILGLLFQSLEIVEYLDQQQVYPMNMRDLTISDSGQIKFPCIYENYMSTYDQLLNNITDEFHISPEELNLLKFKEINLFNLNKEKCQVFQLGLTILWMASLQDPKYLFFNMQININKMIQQINSLNYSSKLKNILHNMLQLQPSQRYFIKDLLQFIKNENKNINLLNYNVNQLITTIEIKNDEYQYSSLPTPNCSARKQQNQYSYMIGSITLKNQNNHNDIELYEFFDTKILQKENYLIQKNKCSDKLFNLCQTISKTQKPLMNSNNNSFIQQTTYLKLEEYNQLENKIVNILNQNQQFLKKIDQIIKY